MAGPGLMLDNFLETMAATVFEDGVSDCIMTPANWIVANGWPDPAVDLRGRYRTALGRERLLRRLGGMEAVVVPRMALSGLTATDNQVRGDVGLIAIHDRIFGAIFLGCRWAVQSRTGLFGVTPLRIVRAWSISHG